MNTHTLTAAAGAVAGLALGFAGTAIATSPGEPPAACVAALEHAEQMAEHNGRRIAGMAAWHLALEAGMDARAERIGARVIRDRDAYLAEHVDYAAAATACR